MKIGIDARLIAQTGVGRYTRNLLKELKKIDKKNQYLILQPKINWHSLKEQLFLPLIIWRQKCDLVHFPYFSVPIFYPGRFIITIHDLIPWHYPTGRASRLPLLFYKIKWWAYKLVIFIAAHRAKKIIAVSQTTKKEIINHLKVKPEKVIVIYEGVNNNVKCRMSNLKTASQNLKLLKSLKPKSYLLYVGNSYPHKNLERLITAFIDIRTNSNVKLVLVGPDDYFYKKLKAKVQKMKLKDKVIFYGPANDEQLAILYKNALCLISPSLMEGFGLPGLEAMSLGCLVACSDIPVFREIYQDVPLYFHPYDIKDISRSLKTILYYRTTECGSEHQEVVKKGIERAKKFSWQKMAKETQKIYLDVT